MSKLHHLSPEDKQKGVITLSAGNHAQALAWAATQSGIPSTVVMPAASLRSKIEATRSYGGEVVLTEGDVLETCLTIQKERGLTLVHPFDDPMIIAGQGTVGVEILEDVPEVDAVVVGVGGKVLLARRALGSRAGDWALPGGFVEQGETAHTAVQREVLEETETGHDWEAEREVWRELDENTANRTR